VIATRVGGNAELLEDAMTGRLVPSANAHAMTKAILGYFDDPVTARRNGGAARSAVLRNFSLDRMVSRYQALYDELLASNPARSGSGA
jgi:glycosyltransferase involved in cell wall biosynthesis